MSTEIIEVKDNADIGQGLVQMYQAGFLDGYFDGASGTDKGEYGKKELWNHIKNNCKKAFEKRFMKKIKPKKAKND